MADTPPRPLPPKKEIALALLEGESVFIRLDPRKEGVSVPKNLAKQPQLILQIGLNLAVRIPDLTIDEEGVSCTLRFNRAPFWCRIPWAAIYALAGPDGRGMLWPDDVPPEVAEQMRSGRASAKDTAQAKEESSEGPSASGSKAAKTASRRPRARPAASEPAEGDGAPSSAPRAPARPVLAAVPSPPRPPADPPRVGDPRFGDRLGDRGASGPRGAPPPRVDAPLGAHDRSRVGGAPRRPGLPQAGGSQAGGSQPGGSQGGAKKAKRELPPYLRVVK